MFPRTQAVSIQSSTTSGAATVFLKGAPDFILPRCTAVYNEEGAAVPLDAPALAAFTAALEALGRRGQRVLALCERPLPRTEFPPGFAFLTDPEPNFPVDDLVLVGLVAVADPPRPTTAAAVRELRDAGVQVGGGMRSSLPPSSNYLLTAGRDGHGRRGDDRRGHRAPGVCVPVSAWGRGRGGWVGGGAGAATTMRWRTLL